MADKNSNILKQLQDLALTPPAGAFEKAWEKILLQNEGIGNSEDTGTTAFEKLREYSMQPPELDLKKVLAGEKNTAAKKTVPVISKNLMRAAAVLVTAVISAGLYMAMPKKNDGPLTVEQPVQEFAGSASDTNSKSDAAKAGQQATDRLPSTPAGSAKNGRHGGQAIIYEDAGNLYNNDVLFTLVNYKEYGQEVFFTKTIKDKKITLNQYSYVNLSDKMVAMLQDVYLTKKNGKPSRKAKKAKKKFEKWRKKDERYFDKEPCRNPADIIDLSEFIMKN